MFPSSSSGVKSWPRRRAPSNNAMERTRGEAACSCGRSGPRAAHRQDVGRTLNPREFNEAANGIGAYD